MKTVAAVAAQNFITQIRWHNTAPPTTHGVMRDKSQPAYTSQSLQSYLAADPICFDFHSSLVERSEVDGGHRIGTSHCGLCQVVVGGVKSDDRCSRVLSKAKTHMRKEHPSIVNQVSFLCPQVAFWLSSGHTSTGFEVTLSCTNGDSPRVCLHRAHRRLSHTPASIHVHCVRLCNHN